MCVERPFGGFYTEMVSFRLDGSFFQYSLVKAGFLSKGLTIAVLKSGCTRPEASGVLMMLVIVGRGSHDLETVFWRISKTNCSVTGVNVRSNFSE